MKQILVTGTGRCGTGYIARVLSSVDVNCTHERIWMWPTPNVDFAQRQYQLRDEHPEWGWVGESSWLAVPFLDADFLQDVIIVHLVRQPECVIRSHQGIMNWTLNNSNYTKGRKFIFQQVPELEHVEDYTERSAAFYLKWNRLIESYADVFHRVEDNPRILLNKLDIHWNDKEIFSDTTYNRVERAKRTFQLEDLPPLLLGPILEMAGRYGY